MRELPDVSVAALRRLARSLLYDRDRAEDVVQDAWLLALRRQPPAEGLRAWIAAAIRRIALDSRRAEARRRAREERAARPEALDSAAEVAGRIEIARALVNAVERLEEPYRAAVVLRFFDELPPR